MSPEESKIEEKPEVKGSVTGSLPEARSLKFSHYLLIMLSAMFLSLVFFLLRRDHLELTILQSTVFRCTRMVGVYLVFSIGILIYRYNYKLKDFGLTRKNLLITTILGIGLYTLPLLMFMAHVGDDDFDSHFVNAKRNMDLGELVLVSLFVFVMAATTDIWTRGFVLMTTTGFRGKLAGISLQNLVWFVIHIYEIELLMNAFGLLEAVLLTIVLGVVGDMIALKYKNTIGLGIGHIYLNAVFIIYVRMT